MTDVFRLDYKELDDMTNDTISMFKGKAQELIEYFDSAITDLNPDMRAMALAKTNLEQAIMWAVKSIT